MPKTIGILGGLSYKSTVPYYELICGETFKRSQNARYPEIVLFSVDLEQYTRWFMAGEWKTAGLAMAEIFNRIMRAGADFGLIAANTPHRALPTVRENTELPILSIIDATAEAVLAAGIETVGLLGTRFTMQEDFFKDGLGERGLRVLIPEQPEMIEVNRVIYEELVKGVVLESSRDFYTKTIERLADRGARGVILGCTEIPLLIRGDHSGIPLFDTAEIHATAALERALE